MKCSKQVPTENKTLSLRDIARTTAALLDGKFLPFNGYNFHSAGNAFLDAEVSEIGSVVTGGKPSAETIYLSTTADTKNLSLDDLNSFLFPIGQVLLVQFTTPGSFVGEVTFQIATQDFMTEVFLAQHISSVYQAVKAISGNVTDTVQSLAVLRQGRSTPS